jgi:biotin transport system substrate-specific component
LWPLFLYCFILAVPGDICLCIVAAFIGRRLIPVLGRLG